MEALMRVARAAARAGRWVFDAGAMALGVAPPHGQLDDVVALPNGEGPQMPSQVAAYQDDRPISGVNPTTGLKMNGGAFDVGGFAYGEDPER